MLNRFTSEMCKLAFVTSVELGFACIRKIYSCGANLSLVVTLNDKTSKAKVGRVSLDEFCSINSIPLLKIDHINDPAVVHEILRLGIDWLFIVGWSQLAGKEILSAPKKGVLGMHPTLLPEGRGRAPIPWAILKGLKTTGVTLFKMDEGVDSGPIADQITIPLNKTTTASQLYTAAVIAHQLLISQSIPKLLDGSIRFVPQDNSLATYWPARKPSDGEINLNGSVWDAERIVRGLSKPYPGAYYILGNKKIIIWSASVVPPNSPQINTPFLSFYDGYLSINDMEVNT